MPEQMGGLFCGENNFQECKGNFFFEVGLHLQQFPGGLEFFIWRLPKGHKLQVLALILSKDPPTKSLRMGG